MLRHFRNTIYGGFSCEALTGFGHMELCLGVLPGICSLVRKPTCKDQIMVCTGSGSGNFSSHPICFPFSFFGRLIIGAHYWRGPDGTGPKELHIV